MKTIFTIFLGIALSIILPCAGESQETSPVTFEIKIDDNVGGGYAGEVDLDIIDSKGEVYKVYTASYKDYGPPGTGEKTKPQYPPKKLVKTVEQKTIAALGKALVKADIWSINTPGAGYGGREWTITIDGKTKTIGFGKLPKKLEPVEIIINQILEK